jgi:hypothetical protein
MLKQYRNRIVVVVSILVAAGVLASIGNGCSRSQTPLAQFGSGSSTSSSTAPSSTASSDIPVIPGARTVSLAYSKQVVDQLSACTGLKIPSEKTMAMYDAKKGAISTYGAANTVTSPMMMAITSIAGEVCNDLIDQEAQGARLFNGFDMSGAVLPDSNTQSTSISKIAVSCWQRNETSAERQVLLDMVRTAVGAGEAQAGRKSALMICTAMLSSLDSVLN